jgi:microcystin-dependent protein
MALPYVGEIRIFAGNFAPAGWMLCNGQLLPISENETLFQLIGTTYGGDGQITFGLPDLRGRVPLHQGSGFVLAQTGGQETVTLTAQEIPSHTHGAAAATGTGNSDSPAGANSWAAVATPLYSTAATNAQMNAGALSASGGNQPHANMSPYLTINYIISLFGIFPSPT